MYPRHRVAATPRARDGSTRSVPRDSCYAPPSARAPPPAFLQPSCRPHVRFRFRAEVPAEKTLLTSQTRSADPPGVLAADSTRRIQRSGSGRETLGVVFGIRWPLAANATQFVIHPIIHVEDELPDRVRDPAPDAPPPPQKYLPRMLWGRRVRLCPEIILSVRAVTCWRGVHQQNTSVIRSKAKDLCTSLTAVKSHRFFAIQAHRVHPRESAAKK